MESLLLWVPVVVVMTFVAIGIYLWAVNNGQYDDVDRQGEQLLMQDQEDTQNHSVKNPDNHG